MSKKKLNKTIAAIALSMALATIPVAASAQSLPQLPQIPQLPPIGDIFGDLTKQLTDWVQQQVAQLQKTIDEQIAQAQKDTGAIVTKNSTNGIPDPLKAKKELNDDLKRKLDRGDLSPNILGLNGTSIQNGLTVYNATAETQLNGVLGEEAQKRNQAQMQKIAQIPASSAQRVQASGAIVQSSTQAAQNASQIDQSTQAAQASQDAAKKANDLGEAAQKDVSTQDVVKKSAAATGQLATIMGGLSTQASFQASQVSNVAEILSGQSSQIDQSIGLQAENLSLAATQVVKTDQIVTATTVTGYGIKEGNSMKQGEMNAAQAKVNAVAAASGNSWSNIGFTK